MRSCPKRVIFIVGPTAVGKTKVAVELARRIKAEIVSCDSMQVYKGMDIVTSKPSAVLEKDVPHHLIDVVSPTKEYNVARYCRQAREKIKDILRRGKTPLLVGGSGLYISALINGIFKVRAQNRNIREELYCQVEKQGSGWLYARLKRIDPLATEKIHPHDTRRIIRALEAYRVSGRPISELQSQRKGIAAVYEIKIFCLNMERDQLYRRIEARIEEMFREGLVREIKAILKIRLSQTARYAIGIEEIKGYLNGAYDLAEAKRLMKRNSRHYAKRQLSWFRRDRRIVWINILSQEGPKHIAQRLWKELSQ
jgi:tRNA dimethylallyltransferase